MHDRDVRSASQHLREAHGRVALPRQAQRQGRKRSMREPHFHRPGNRAVLGSPGAQGGRFPSVARGDVTQNQIAMTGDRFCI